MIELWGADDCEGCVKAKELLGRTPLEWNYVDVANTGFEGRIPRLVLEDGKNIVDLPGIISYVEKRMRELGIRI